MYSRIHVVLAAAFVLSLLASGCQQPDRRVYSYKNRDADAALYQADSEVQKAFRLARRYAGSRAASSLDLAEREARHGLVTAGEAVDEYEESDDDDRERDEAIE